MNFVVIIMADLFKRFFNRKGEGSEKIVPKNPSRYSPIASLPGGFGIVVVDMQGDFLKNIERERRREMVRSQLDVLEVCTEKGYPVVVLEYDGHQKTIRPILREASRAQKFARIIKGHDNGFSGTGLENVLEEFNINCMGVMGVNASSCVRSTAKIGLSKGFRFLTAESLIADNKNHTGERWNHIRVELGTNWYADHAEAYFEDYRDLVGLMKTS